MTSALILSNLHKSFNNQPLLRGVSLEIARGEIACLLGPSGSGKSTLLRIIAGLEQAESGDVTFENQNLRGVPTHLRGIGLMFQDLALFPHRSVFDNVAFGLRMQSVPRAEIAARVRAMLKLVGLENFGARNVHQLSGGEQQRVALARALAPRPRLLMFDEPLGALDRILREQLQSQVRGILKQIGMTALYVTHDQGEAFAVADRVLIIHDGVIAQSGTPQELYEHPASEFVAQFLGLSNLLTGVVTRVDGASVAVETADGVLTVRASGVTKGTRVTALIRPNAAQAFIAARDASPRADSLACRVLESRFAERARVLVETRSGARLWFESSQMLSAGAEVWVDLNPSAISILPIRNPHSEIRN